MTIQVASLVTLLILLLASLWLRFHRGTLSAANGKQTIGTVVGSVDIPFRGQLHIITVGCHHIALFTSPQSGSAMLQLSHAEANAGPLKEVRP